MVARRSRAAPRRAGAAVPRSRQPQERGLAPGLAPRRNRRTTTGRRRTVEPGTGCRRRHRLGFHRAHRVPPRRCPRTVGWGQPYRSSRRPGNSMCRSNLAGHHPRPKRSADREESADPSLMRTAQAARNPPSSSAWACPVDRLGLAVAPIGRQRVRSTTRRTGTKSAAAPGLTVSPVCARRTGHPSRMPTGPAWMAWLA